MSDDPSFTEEGFIAEYREEAIFTDDGVLIGREFIWDSIENRIQHSMRIHGEAVPEPATTMLLYWALMIRWKREI